MNTTQKTIQVHAARLCQAIARIGYEPQIALMDIVDNSVTANASQIKISIFLSPGKTLKNRNSVQKYQIVDNGVGMTDEEISNAFELGANGDYPLHSLSKYGMGLKSAGLSLGTRIHIISKKSGKLSARQTFDIELIAQEDKFIVSISDLVPEEVEYYGNLLSDDAGTVVEIDGCENINHQSPGTTVRKLEEHMGVVYNAFLSDPKRNLKIGIRVCANDTPEFKEIVPVDILFREMAKSWDPENYDFFSPYLLFDEEWKPDLGDGKNIPPIPITAVAFPQDKLGNPSSPLSQEQQRVVKQYQVSRANAGCFIYRNGRLIRWADGLDGILSKDEFNLRVRMDLTEEHDDIFHVDVTKQRLEIDDVLLARLKRILDDSKTSAKVIMKKCSEYMKKPTGTEGAAFSEISANVPEDDPEEMASGTPPPEVLDRQQSQAEEAEKIIEATIGTDSSDSTSSKLGRSPFAKVRYTGEVEYGHLWTPYRDAKEGVFVCVNTHHPFYTEFMHDLADNSAERLLLEALIFAAGVGQINTVGHLHEVPLEDIKAVFGRFHSNCGTYLASFTSENINLLEK
ncbi:hypothetical protein J2S30_003732 [Herbaspirillum rubrisubalbicans]|uniref:ATP-binding protein n=1 Tax=Herbaspirillum rubrisubalbicans TaxID=80842 RepID=UPI00209CFC9C|nr:ATP-binding protein [Herbaspirillum rubrisubalbicans]MCP1575353.1 hypothetical protein [Herbaspirillum rubrisubalbicans]